MIGMVIVSHSQKLAEGVVELVRAVAPDARIAAAGGLRDGSLGTSYDKIAQAVSAVDTEEGVLVLMDMGSAVMTTEMVLEDIQGTKIQMVNCPLVEGAVVGAVQAGGGIEINQLAELLNNPQIYKKF